MGKQLALMQLREARIAALVKRIREHSKGFQRPPLVVIGGYALRAFVPFARHSRDCDFAVPKSKDWVIDRVPTWFDDLTVEAKEQQEGHGYLRLVQLLPVQGARSLEVSLDFMEGEIRGRAGERILLDDAFVQGSTEAVIPIAGRDITIRAPSYQDYLLLKLVSARPSDIRDIAALVWQRGIPPGLMQRAATIVKAPLHLGDKLNVIITDIADDRFLDSWRGTFITTTLTDGDKRHVLQALRHLKSTLHA